MTNITRSMVVCGRELSSSIDFSHETAVCLTGDKKWTETYASNQAQLLLHSREIVSLLIGETRSYHRKKMNELRHDPSATNWATLSWQSVEQNYKALYAHSGP